MSGPERRRRLARTLWVAAALVLAVVLGKFFVADVYRVDSGSMSPTILGGRGLNERVLVTFGGVDDLRRFDLVVVESSASTRPMVKRVVGLPREAVGVSGGDLLVDGRRLPPDAPRPALVPVFDPAHHAVEEGFRFEDGPTSPWSVDGDVWTLDATAIPPGTDRGLMLTRRPLFDDHLDASFERVPGRVSVHDGAIEVDARVSDRRDGGSLVLRALEEGDTFQCVVDAASGEARLTRRNAATIADPAVTGADAVLATAPAEALLDGEWHRLRLSNVDNHLCVMADGEALLAASYDQNEPHPGAAIGAAEGVDVLGARFAFGATGCRVEFRAPAVSRDLHYTNAGTFGVGAAVRLGPDEVFVLGDNSSDSRDSRIFGPVLLRDVIGRPKAVVWPPGRARRLE